MNQFVGQQLPAGLRPGSILSPRKTDGAVNAVRSRTEPISFRCGTAVGQQADIAEVVAEVSFEQRSGGGIQGAPASRLACRLCCR